ncbi:hypothetical protein GGI20_005206 [Coemansia sp. BCRC 34301]|nr:hypothetical protein GGI20_005206 [Coemansia sp. BCRC 34301]
MSRLPPRLWHELWVLGDLAERSRANTAAPSAIIKREVVENSGLSNMYKAIYSLLVVVWIAIVGGVLYLAARRYRRNRLLRAQGIDPDGQPQTGGGSAKRQKRLLDRDEILALPVVMLTEDDIQRSKRLAHNHRPPSAPDAIPSRPSRASVDLPAAMPLVSGCLQAPAAVVSPVRAQPTIVDSALANNGGTNKALALCDQAPIHEENCAVCLEDFGAGDEVRRLPCRHFFHVVCIDPWLSERAATCPLCNLDVAQVLTP